jgi:hypothetical protein
MENDWEYYKDIMRQHFLTDKSLKEVMEFMKNTYNFRARYASVLRLRRLRAAKFFGIANRNTKIDSRYGGSASTGKVASGRMHIIVSKSENKMARIAACMSMVS